MSFLDDDNEQDQRTHEAMQNPQVGDRFSEFCSFWIYVIAISGNTVITTEGSPPVTFPEEGKVKAQTREEFIARFAYGSIPGYWIRLADRGNNVEGWWDPSPASCSQANQEAK